MIDTGRHLESTYKAESIKEPTVHERLDNSEEQALTDPFSSVEVTGVK
jgi:hypothetical protein